MAIKTRRPLRRSRAPAPIRRAVVDTDHDFRERLRRELSGNEFKLVDMLLGRPQFSFTGTVPQAAEAAGLSQRQCERARASLKKRGVIQVRMNAKQGRRRHNSTMVLDQGCLKSTKKSRLIGTLISENKDVQELTAENGGAISNTNKKDIIRLNSKEMKDQI